MSADDTLPQQCTMAAGATQQCQAAVQSYYALYDPSNPNSKNCLQSNIPVIRAVFDNCGSSPSCSAFMASDCRVRSKCPANLCSVTPSQGSVSTLTWVTLGILGGLAVIIFLFMRHSNQKAVRERRLKSKVAIGPALATPSKSRHMRHDHDA